MASSIGQLVIGLTADTGQATGDLGRAAHQIERDMERMAVRASAAGAAIGIALSEVGKRMLSAGRDAILLGDQLGKLSQRTGLAVGRLSEIAFAGELADVSMNQLGRGMGLFNKALVEAQKEGGRTSEIFAALGVDITQGPQAAFEQFAKSINTLPDGELKASAMRAAFGQAGDALIPLIGGLDDATSKARRMGLVMSEQLSVDSARLNDAMTTLSASTRALTITGMTPLARWLAEVSENMVAARLNGNLLSVSLAELGKTWAALWGGMAEKVGASRVADLMQDEFNRMDAIVQRMTALPPVAGGVNPGGLDGTAGDNPALNRPGVDEVRLRDALARMGASKGSRGAAKSAGSDNLLGKQLQEDMDERAKIMAEAASATDKYNQRLRDQVQAETDAEVARAQVIVDMQEIIDQQIRMAEGWDENGRKIAETTQTASRFARDMGLSFTSAFEDAVIAGKKLSEVLRAVGEDIAKVILRKTVTEPAGEFLSGVLDKVLDGIFKAEGGPISGGRPYIVGERGPELFVPGLSGTIVPNHALAGVGGGVNVTQVIHFSGTTPAAVRDAVYAMAPQLTRAAIEGVRADRNRTGDHR